MDGMEALKAQIEAVDRASILQKPAVIEGAVRLAVQLAEDQQSQIMEMDKRLKVLECANGKATES